MCAINWFFSSFIAKFCENSIFVQRVEKKIFNTLWKLEDNNAIERFFHKKLPTSGQTAKPTKATAMKSYLRTFIVAFIILKGELSIIQRKPYILLPHSRGHHELCSEELWQYKFKFMQKKVLVLCIPWRSIKCAL